MTQIGAGHYQIPKYHILQAKSNQNIDAAMHNFMHLYTICANFLYYFLTRNYSLEQTGHKVFLLDRKKRLKLDQIKHVI